MRNILILLCGLTVLLSCARKNEEPPAGVLSKPEMVALLQEIYLKEAKISKLSLPFDSSQAIFQRVEDELFKQYEVTDTLYSASMDWYYEHPDQLQEVYEILVDSLMVMEKRHQNVVPDRGSGTNEEALR